MATARAGGRHGTLLSLSEHDHAIPHAYTLAWGVAMMVTDG